MRGLTTVEIKKRMLDVEVTISDLAESIGCARSQVSSTIAMRHKTPYIRRQLAELLGMTYLGMWGELDPGVDRLPGGIGPDSVTAVNGTPQGGTAAQPACDASNAEAAAVPARALLT